MERTRLTGKEIVSFQNKMCHNKTIKKLKTLVIIKTIYEENSSSLLFQNVLINIKLFLKQCADILESGRYENSNFKIDG